MAERGSRCIRTLAVALAVPLLVAGPGPPAAGTALLHERPVPATASGPERSASASTTATAALVPLSPTRVLDTRTGFGSSRPPGRMPDGGTLSLRIAGAFGIPAAATAVVGNLTITDTTLSGFVTLWGRGTRPVASTVNATGPGETIANAAVVPLDADGSVHVYVQRATNVVLDVTGVFVPATVPAAGRFQPIWPSRLLDTRIPTGGGRPGDGGSISLQVTGRGGVPAANVQAVAMTVTATNTTRPGFVTVWPSGPMPLASALNVPGPGANVANLVVVPVDPLTGRVQLYAQRSTDLVADVVGWFTGPGSPPGDDGLFVAADLHRIADTRDGWQASRLRAESSISIDATPAGVTGWTARAVVVNNTAVDVDGPGHLTVWTGRAPRPLASNLNTSRSHEVRAGLSITTVDRGRYGVFASTGSDYVADLAGWFTGTGDDALRLRCPTPAPADATAYQQVFDQRGPRWQAADLAGLVTLDDGRRLFLFGDTLTGLLGPGNSWIESTTVLANSAWAQDGGCFQVLGTPTSAYVPEPADGQWYWPSTGWQEGDRIYVVLNRLVRTPTQPPFGFRPVGTDLAVLRSSDFALETILPLFLPAQTSFDAIGWGDATVVQGAYRYVYGHTHGTLYVARTDARHAMAGPVEVWDGAGWSRDLAAARPMLTPGRIETRPAVIPFRQGFLMVSKVNTMLTDGIRGWSAPNPWGPWTDLGNVVPTTPTGPGEMTYMASLFSDAVAGLVVTWNLMRSDGIGGDVHGYGPRFATATVR